MIDQRIKDRAHAIDPECWVSYSGKPREVKRYVDGRRTASLLQAKRELEAEGIDFSDSVTVAPGTSLIDFACADARREVAEREHRGEVVTPNDAIHMVWKRMVGA